MPATTTRFGLRYPLLSETADVPRDIGNLATDIDNILATFSKGLLGVRPTSSGGSPGIAGRTYYANDAGDSLGDLYFDYGTGWRKYSLYQTNGNMSFTGHAYPSVDNTYDLGIVTTNRWRNLHMLGNINNAGGASYINFSAQSAGNYPLLLNRTGDANYRFVLKEDGTHEWGAGTGSRDTFLSRSSANTLNTAGYFQSSANGSLAPSITVPSIDVVGSGAFGSKLAADSVYRFTIYGDGKHAWSDGTAARDTFLYRQAAGVIGVTSSILLDASAGGAYRGQQTAAAVLLRNKLLETDTQSSFFIQGDGKHGWGAGGSSASDTFLYRVSANALKTDGSFSAIGTIYTTGASASYAAIANSGGQALVQFSVTGDSVNRLLINGNGSLSWGPGGVTAQDTALSRSGAAQLDFTNNSTGWAQLRYSNSVLIGTTAGNPILRQFFLAGDSQPAFQIYGDGKHFWGAGGSSAADTFLSRTAVNTLRTDGFFYVGTVAPVTNAILSALQSGNAIEFGHASGGQYHSVLGDEVGSGANFLAFHGAAGTNSGTYRTFGYKASVFKADTAGGFVWATVANVNADNQALVQLATLDSSGIFTSNQLKDSSGGTMRVHRHPYANARHIESGSVTLGAGGGASVSITFTDAFSSPPNVIVVGTAGNGFPYVSAVSTTGATFTSFSSAPSTWGSQTVYWIAEGVD